MNGLPHNREAAAGPTVECLTTVEALAPWAEAWDRLVEAMPAPLPMASHAWTGCELDRKREHAPPWVCVLAHTDGRLGGALPVFLGKRRLAVWRRTVAETPFNWHTMGCDIVTASGCEDEVVPALLDGLNRAVPDWLGLHVRRVPAESRALAYLGRTRGPWRVVKSFHSNGALVPIEGDYDGYLNTLADGFRRNLLRFQRKTGRLPDVEFLCARGIQATDEHLSDFARLEAAGWKGRQGSAVAVTPELMQFYRTLTQRLAARGWLEWRFLRAEGKLLAGQLGVRIGRALILLKIAYDEAYTAYAPGNVLLAHTIECAFAAGDLDEVNCMTDYPWTRNWRMRVRPHYSLAVFPRKPVSLLFGYLPRKARVAARDVRGVASLYRFARAAVARRGDRRTASNGSPPAEGTPA